MIQLVYNGVNITNDVKISQALFEDAASGQADSVEVVFNDTQGIWSSWNPQAGDTVELACDGLSSGLCYVDDIRQQQGYCVVRGLSTPFGCKIARSRSWENVALLQVAVDMASRYGFSASSYLTLNPTYSRLDQAGQTDFSFLLELCRLESCGLKVSGGKVILYSEPDFEGKPPAKLLTPDHFKQYPDYRRQTVGLLSGVTVQHGEISGSFSAGGPYGVKTVGDIYVTSVGEAQRFAKGLLRDNNKGEFVLTGIIEMDPGLTAASVVQVQGFGMGDGIYFTDHALHDFVGNTSFLRLRKRLEGY